MWLQKRKLWCSKQNVLSTKFDWILFLILYLLLKSHAIDLSSYLYFNFLTNIFFLLFSEFLPFCFLIDRNNVCLFPYYLILSSLLIVLFAEINSVLTAFKTEISFYCTLWQVPLLLALPSLSLPSPPPASTSLSSFLLRQVLALLLRL